ncbi:MAG: alpha/beta fold hydrolase BchO [Pseudomonadota bacterium]
MAQRTLNWNEHKYDWPHAGLSRFVRDGTSQWHVQEHGRRDSEKPLVLLLHGTGASTHSWTWLIPHLTDELDFVAIDLPGHGFTQTASASALSLPAMAFGVAKLMGRLELAPHFIIGHSAGTAIGLQIAINRNLPNLKKVIGINAALQPIEGNSLLSPLAKLLFVNPVTPRLFAWQARNTAIADKMLDATGSKLSDQQRDYYLRLFGASSHVEGALGMMASWELAPLRKELLQLETPALLLAAKDDRMVPASVSKIAARSSGNLSYMELKIGGHLVHETHPELVANEVRKAIQSDVGES